MTSHVTHYTLTDGTTLPFPTINNTVTCSSVLVAKDANNTLNLTATTTANEFCAGRRM